MGGIWEMVVLIESDGLCIISAGCMYDRLWLCIASSSYFSAGKYSKGPTISPRGHRISSGWKSYIQLQKLLSTTKTVMDE